MFFDPGTFYSHTLDSAADARRWSALRGSAELEG
jgi:hypothetical protein